MSTRHEQIVTTLERLSVSIGSDMIGAVAVSIDGLVLAAQMASDINAERVGAVAATMVGVARRVSNELKIGLAEEVILKSQQGMFVVLPAGDQGLVAVNVRQGSNLGMVRLETRDAAASIGRVL